MKTAKELVDQINAANVIAPHAVEDVIDMDGVTEVTTLDLDGHRWYVLGTVVFKTGDEFFGVRGPVSLKSESMEWADVGAKCEAFEMEQVPSVTYQRKKPSEFRLPVVAGRRSSQSNANFERACLVHIERLQHGLGPYDSAMMATFCEAVRMVREYSDAMQVRNPNDKAQFPARSDGKLDADVGG